LEAASAPLPFAFKGGRRFDELGLFLHGKEEKMEEIKGRRKPDWLKIKVPKGKEYIGVREVIDRNKLHTICTSGHCPNKEDCWGRGTATFMILGNICTRSCKFCSVATGRPLPADLAEPERVAESVSLMKLRHAVITSVDRDDLEDGGAGIWAATIRAVREKNPGVTMETLIPDFRGRRELLQIVIDARPDVISHNLETVRRLTPQVRSAAIYERSLEVIQRVAASGIRSKSGIMLGLGETEEEVIRVMDDLRGVGCEVMTIGQYLQPTLKHLPVMEYIQPGQFEKYRRIGLAKGFRHIESGPLVRSSYHAEKHIQ
jgi:lipoic acid synthetase